MHRIELKGVDSANGSASDQGLNRDAKVQGYFDGVERVRDGSKDDEIACSKPRIVRIRW